MISQSTLDKLIEMKFTAMADALLGQQSDSKIKNLDFNTRFDMLVDIEYCSRKNNKLQRLIKRAALDQPDASIACIDYVSGRELNRNLIEKLATCEYIDENRNVFITGATGSGKTYLACALGMAACKQYRKTQFVRLPDLLIELETSRADLTYKSVLEKYCKPELLIIDEWLLYKPSEEELRDILELLHKRRKKSSTIFCSQYRKEEWYEQMGKDSTLTDAILDRIVYDAYNINIVSKDPRNEISMRDLYGLDKKERNY